MTKLKKIVSVIAEERCRHKHREDRMETNFRLLV